MASPSTSGKEKLTGYLMGIDPEGFKNATEARFLENAGKGTLQKETLERWLGHDRLYAQAYIRFAALLLANIHLPLAVEPENVNEK